MAIRVARIFRAAQFFQKKINFRVASQPIEAQLHRFGDAKRAVELTQQRWRVFRSHHGADFVPDWGSFSQGFEDRSRGPFPAVLALRTGVSGFYHAVHNV